MPQLTRITRDARVMGGNGEGGTGCFQLALKESCCGRYSDGPTWRRRRPIEMDWLRVALR